MRCSSFYLFFLLPVRWWTEHEGHQEWKEQKASVIIFHTLLWHITPFEAHFKPSRIPLVRAQGSQDKEKAITNTEEGVDSITNINQCLQHPFFFPIYISLYQARSVNHSALKAKKVLTFNEESLPHIIALVHCVPVYNERYLFLKVV